MCRTKPSAVALTLVGMIYGYGDPAWADHGSLGFGIGTASPILTQTGVTLPAGMWAAGLITQFIQFDSASDAKLRYYQHQHGDVHSTDTLLQPSIFAAYGVTDDLTLGLRLPWVLRSGVKTPNDDGVVMHQGDPSGFGDISLFGQYRVFYTADNLNQLSLVAGLKLPTGATRTKTNQGEIYEAHHQPGTGSWDPSVGFNFTRAMGDWSFDSNMLYTFSEEGTQRTKIGDGFDYNFAVSYGFGAPVRNAFFAASNNAPWTAVLELTGTWRGKQTAAGISDPNSGGNTIYINPGIRFSGGKGWNTALSIGAPILTDYNGYQTPPDYRIVYRFVATF
ncbi:MAG: transporter [Methylococcaceae bacterium]|nr:transporter [Methylococcaceae bacterium]